MIIVHYTFVHLLFSLSYNHSCSSLSTTVDHGLLLLTPSTAFQCLPLLNIVKHPCHLLPHYYSHSLLLSITALIYSNTVNYCLMLSSVYCCQVDITSCCLTLLPTEASYHQLPASQYQLLSITVNNYITYIS